MMTCTNHTNALVSTALALALATALPAPASAQRVEEQASFDFVIKGISAATLSFSGVQDGNRYAVSGVVKSAGLAALFRKISYTAEARGAVSGSKYTPASYTETSDNGKRKSQSKMSYSRGVPSAVQYTPPREGRDKDVNPASQGGTVDTLTALYAILRDVDAGQECKVSLKMYDGRYVSTIAVSNPKKKGDGVICSGQYRRVDGFKPEEMAERTKFPFTVRYVPLGDGRMQVTEVVMQSIYGNAALKRR
ncbi:DUF3108 domain-containing protein [Pseudorhodobacter sp.]|uniref:DUF3108 domain-containing protein n=1 Tax=Pseudorhodobacter sp. TaxID=1934400 RepID=UPI0026473241|nr:DUF3108 domain-containing protein [Pseudorhodobacter sp.]MDN5786126.1 DUF3108 domain-containing protein [Pseudorhodobacter sp.]